MNNPEPHFFDTSFGADWRIVGTVKKLEEELIGFKFNGPGWYVQKKDTLLVIPTSRNYERLWNYFHSDEEQFAVYVYNDRNPTALFCTIATAPTRQDER